MPDHEHQRQQIAPSEPVSGSWSSAQARLRRPTQRDLAATAARCGAIDIGGLGDTLDGQPPEPTRPVLAMCRATISTTRRHSHRAATDVRRVEASIATR